MAVGVSVADPVDEMAEGDIVADAFVGMEVGSCVTDDMTAAVFVGVDVCSTTGLEDVAGEDG